MSPSVYRRPPLLHSTFSTQVATGGGREGNELFKPLSHCANMDKGQINYFLSHSYVGSAVARRSFCTTASSRGWASRRGNRGPQRDAGATKRNADRHSQHPTCLLLPIGHHGGSAIALLGDTPRHGAGTRLYRTKRTRRKVPAIQVHLRDHRCRLGSATSQRGGHRNGKFD